MSRTPSDGYNGPDTGDPNGDAALNDNLEWDDAVAGVSGAVTGSASDHSVGVDIPTGSGSWSTRSTRSAKENVEPVDLADVLDGVRALDISTWNYTGQDESIQHMGPMAEDFYDAFGLGGDRERIAGVDADGVAFGAIQALADELEAADERIDDLEAENEALRGRLSALDARLAALEDPPNARDDD